MSITNTLYIGVSGLDAHADAISVVGDNIANTSTVGFKRERAMFADMLGGQLGSQRLGGGVVMGGTQTMFDQGALQTTGNPLDLAIRGGGMFVVKGNYAGQTGDYYTRAGQFHLDNQGYVVNPDGLRLQGYTIDSAGTRSTIASDLPLGARQSPPVATTDAKMTLNLDANAAAPAAFDPANPTATSNYATSVTAHDSLGASHHVEVYFRAQGGGAWEWHAMVDGSELSGGAPGTATEIATGTMAFSPSGALQTQTTTASSASFIGATPNQAITFNFGDDIASGGTGLAGTTQFSGTSTVNGLDIDGHGAGSLTSLSVGDDGKVTGVYDNGDRITLAQVSLAEFANQDGLMRAGDSLMTETTKSGAALVDAPGTGARGSISAGSLEGSNVDLSNELVTLIAYQRAYEANAKTVTTADEMMQDVTNLKR